MKASVLFKEFVVVCAIGYGAGVQAASHSMTEHSMIGCLQAGSESGIFMLTDPAMMNGPTTTMIAESTIDLSGHVGHKVEITGTTITGSDPSVHTMKATGMKHLAATCP